MSRTCRGRVLHVSPRREPAAGRRRREGARDPVLRDAKLRKARRRANLRRDGSGESLACLRVGAARARGAGPVGGVGGAARAELVLSQVEHRQPLCHPNRGWYGARETGLLGRELLKCAGEEEGGGEGARDVGLLYPEPSEPGGRRGEGDRQRARNGGPLDVDHLEGRKEPELRRQRPPEAVDASPLDLGDLAFFARDKLLLAARDRRVDPRPPATHQHPRLSRRRRRSARRRQRGRRRLRWLRRRRRRPRRRRRRRGRRRRR
mmetsp:Transcript_4334/g.13980  ORF Transcript_4334/g.13980 Transcript_4334/m.13980 type:complete len:263 (+) Transcript_4334:178-966(+)